MMWSTHTWVWVAALVTVLFQHSAGIVLVTSDFLAFELGQPFKFRCSLPNPKDFDLESITRPTLFIYRKDKNEEQLLLRQFINASFLIAFMDCVFARDIVDRALFSFKAQVQNFILIKSKAACSDDGDEYKCVLTAHYPGVAAQTVVNSSHIVHLNARPQKPLLTQRASSVGEHENISITCVGNVGRPGQGVIKWRVTVPGMAPDTPGVNDSRVTTKITQGHPPCTEEQQSTLTLTNVTRHQHKATVYCFMSHRDFRPEVDTECRNPDKQLCAKSKPIAVYYPVTSVSLALLKPLHEAGPVTLVCSTESFPSPQFVWTFPTDNRLWLVSDSGSESRRTLTTFNMAVDTGEYSCTAYNAYHGNNYSQTSHLRLAATQVGRQESTFSLSTPSIVGVTVSAILSFSLLLVFFCWEHIKKKPWQCKRR